MLVRQRWNQSQRFQALGGGRLGQLLKEIQLTSVVGEILLQLADGGVCSGVRRQFALQTVERRLDQPVDGAQVETRLRCRQCDDDEAQQLAERAADAKSIARFGTVFGRDQAVDL